MGSPKQEHHGLPSLTNSRRHLCLRVLMLLGMAATQMENVHFRNMHLTLRQPWSQEFWSATQWERAWLYI
jgi:hypothetical protein